MDERALAIKKNSCLLSKNLSAKLLLVLMQRFIYLRTPKSHHHQISPSNNTAFIGSDHQLQKVLIAKRILLISAVENVYGTVWRIWACEQALLNLVLEAFPLKKGKALGTRLSSPILLFSSAPRSRVLARLASLAQIGELARRRGEYAH